PVITIMLLQVTGLLGGAIITESVFAIPGIGTLSISALTNRDMPLLQGTIILSTALIIAGNLLADIICAFIDPRIRAA
ncbi:MAG: ABC transporter permease subunit, partial [Treponema sp.]